MQESVLIDTMKQTVSVEQFRCLWSCLYPLILDLLSATTLLLKHYTLFLTGNFELKLCIRCNFSVSLAETSYIDHNVPLRTSELSKMCRYGYWATKYLKLEWIKYELMGTLERQEVEQLEFRPIGKVGSIDNPLYDTISRVIKRISNIFVLTSQWYILELVIADFYIVKNNYCSMYRRRFPNNDDHITITT